MRDLAAVAALGTLFVTTAAGAQEKYVTIIAQPDFDGPPAQPVNQRDGHRVVLVVKRPVHALLRIDRGKVMDEA